MSPEHEKSRDDSQLEQVDVDFFGVSITVPRQEYEVGLKMAALSSDSVMLHDALKAAADPSGAYLPDELRNLLAKSILYCAGDHRHVARVLSEGLVEELERKPTKEEVGRVARVEAAMMSATEALECLPNVPLQIGKICEIFEDMVEVVLRSRSAELDALREFLGKHIRTGARLTVFRLISSMLADQEYGG